MPFVFLMLFALICLQTQWPAPDIGLTDDGCAMLAGTLVLASWFTAGLIGKVLAWQLQRHADTRSTILRRYGKWRRYHFIALLTIYLVLLYLGWGHVVTVFWTELATAIGANVREILPGKELAILIPFFTALLFAWERFYQIEKCAYEAGTENDRYLGKTTYLLLQVRHQFLLVMPPMFLLLVQQVLFTIFPELDRHGYLPAILAGVMIVGAFVTMPILLRLFLGLKPLPAGPLRDRLEATARRLHFRFSNVLVWDTRNLFANALVTGFVPWVRYVVLTDRLIDELSEEEIEAVFGHEVGHIKHHHLFFYLAFFLASFIFLGLVWEILVAAIKQPIIKEELIGLPYVGEALWETLRTLSSIGKLGLLAAYTLLVFGFISRRCEHQADLFGAQTVSTDSFINALEKVAVINGIPRTRKGNWLTSWQHPSIGQRVEFLQTMRDHPARMPSFHRGIIAMQWVFYLTLGYLVWQFDLLDVWKSLADF